jgi:HSP20 family protein
MRELVSLSDQINRMFWPGLIGRRFGEEEGLRGSWTPPVDICETEDEVQVVAELPGIDPQKVDVSVEGNLLTIRGERRREEVREDETVHRTERVYGFFERSFSLPRSSDPEKIAAHFKDGVLILSIPKREGAKPKAIKVNVGSG